MKRPHTQPAPAATPTPTSKTIPATVAKALTIIALSLAMGAGANLVLGFGTSSHSPLTPVAELEIGGYMGLWYQVAYYPNRFQKHCAANTTATYRQIPNSTRIEVLNQCQRSDGSWDSALGLARPISGVSQIETSTDTKGVQSWLRPAQLEVSFLPPWLRWIGIGWGSYWVIDYAPDGRYAVISEPKREYLWILSRSAQLSASDRQAIDAQLQAKGFDLQRLQNHPQNGAKPPVQPQ
jgi:apolipoprotein D and lipocalin family protein